MCGARSGMRRAVVLQNGREQADEVVPPAGVERCGLFAAMEVPGPFVRDVREFFLARG